MSPVGAVPPELIEELRRHKFEVLALLDWEAAAWPPECLEAERDFGQRHARLYPLLGKIVSTPYGRGKLVQAFSVLAAVILCGRVVFVPPIEVTPEGIPCRSPDLGGEVAG